MPAPSVTLSFDSALGGGSSSSTITGPATVNEGDLLIACVVADDTQLAFTGSTTGETGWPAGWTVLHSGVAKSAGGDCSGYAAWKIAGASDVATGTGKDYTITWTSAGAVEGSAVFFRIPAGEFDATTPIDASSVTVTGGGATSIALGGITTTVADTRLIAWFAVDESNATYSPYWTEPPITGWTSLLGTSGTSSGLGGSSTYAGAATTTQASAGATGNKTATIRVENDAIVGFLIAVRPAAGGTPVTATLAGTAPAPSGAVQGTLTVAGAVAGTAPAPTGSLAAAVTVAGSLAGNGPTPTGSVVGVVTVTGALTGEAPTPTGAVQGTVTVTGALAGTAPATSGALVGNVGDDVTATLAGEAPTTTGAVAGTVTVTTTLAGSAPTPTGALAGNVGDDVTATLAGTAPAPTGSLAAAVTVTATLAGNAPAPTGSLVGNVGDTITATLAGTAPAPTGSVAGVVTVTGALTGTAPAPTAALAAAVVGAAALTLRGGAARFVPNPLDATLVPRAKEAHHAP